MLNIKKYQSVYNGHTDILVMCIGDMCLSKKSKNVQRIFWLHGFLFVTMCFLFYVVCAAFEQMRLCIALFRYKEMFVYVFLFDFESENRVFNGEI